MRLLYDTDLDIRPKDIRYPRSVSHPASFSICSNGWDMEVEYKNGATDYAVPGLLDLTIYFASVWQVEVL